MASVVIAPTIILSDIPVGAQEIKEIGQFGDWKAYIRSDNNERFCYIVSKPKEASLRSRRGDIFLMVWHRPAKKEFDVGDDVMITEGPFEGYNATLFSRNSEDRVVILLKLAENYLKITLDQSLIEKPS